MFWMWLSLAVLLDQAFKYLVTSNMQLGQSLPLIEGVVYATYVMNKGAAFSILQGWRWFFLLTTPVVFIGILWFAHSVPKSDKLLKTALALFCGGALGNYIDRLRFGAVTDFIDFRFFPIFNIADSCIVIGVILLGWRFLLRAEKNSVKGDI